MIRIHNRAYRNSEERLIPLDEVNIVTHKINCYKSGYNHNIYFGVSEVPE